MASPWHPVDINAAIRKAGLTHEEIAKRTGYSRSTVTHTIRTGSNKAVRDFISALVNASVEEIWPFRISPPRT